MTTPMLRDSMALAIAGGIDPTDFQWFDLGSNIDQTHQQADWLKEYRPPFEKCFVVYRGPTRNHAMYEVMMLVAGDDPEEGIIITMWKGPTGKRPRTLPQMVYVVDGDMVRYGPVEEGAAVEEGEARLMLAILAAWYAGLAVGCNAHAPYIKPTFTNQRKMAAGKSPSYDWRTVVIGPKKAKGESLGGTHASPREHDRRGHLRRLRSGKNVWVRQCKVGSASLGAVFHDYEMKEAA